MLFTKSGKEFVSSRVPYLDVIEGMSNSVRIHIEVKFANLMKTFAVVDTGSRWCILNQELALAYDPKYKTNSIESTSLIIRGIETGGHLIRMPITIYAEEGDNITIEGTVFVPESDMDFPNFFGLEGLNRIKFAVDPHNTIFYFGCYSNI